MDKRIECRIKQKKAQVFTTDVVFSIIIFAVIFMFLISIWGLYSQHLLEQQANTEMELLAFQIAEILVSSPGVPNNWETLTSQSSFSSDATTIGGYNFNEGSGQTLIDEVGKSNGTLGATSAVENNDPTWLSSSSCESGTCLSLDGSNDFINISNSAAFNNLKNFTIELWVYPTQDKSSQEEHIVNKNSQWYIKLVSGMKPSFLINGVGQYTANTALPLNTWTHIALTNQFYVESFTNYNNISFYVNGMQIFAATKQAGTPQSSTNPIFIGRQALAQNYFPGRVDWLQFSSTAKTSFNLQPTASTTGILTLGLAKSDRTLSPAKTNAFFGLDYSQLKKLFNVARYDLQIRLMEMNGTTLKQIGTAPGNTSERSVSLQKIVLHNETARKVQLILWSD